VQDGSSGRDIIAAGNHAGRQIFFNFFCTQIRSQISQPGQLTRPQQQRRQQPGREEKRRSSEAADGCGRLSRFPRLPIPEAQGGLSQRRAATRRGRPQGDGDTGPWGGARPSRK
jgi:hypothetical protein